MSTYYCQNVENHGCFCNELFSSTHWRSTLILLLIIGITIHFFFFSTFWPHSLSLLGSVFQAKASTITTTPFRLIIQLASLAWTSTQPRGSLTSCFGWAWSPRGSRLRGRWSKLAKRGLEMAVFEKQNMSLNIDAAVCVVCMFLHWSGGSPYPQSSP